MSRMTTIKDVLEPIDGYAREVGFYLAGLEEVRAQTLELLADMSDKELSKKIAPAFPQIGGLALHLGECEFWWIEVGLAKKEITDADRKFAHLYDTTTTDFALKNYHASDCIEILQNIHRRTAETLLTCSDEDMDAVFSNDLHPDGFTGSLRWILHHLIDHESNHRGQMAMIKRIIRGG